MEYAVLFGNTNVINYLVDLGAKLESNLEGMPLLHLSLSFAGKEYY